MNRNQLTSYFDLCKGQLLMLLVGMVLTFWPGSAVALIIKIGGWILLATGIYNVIKSASRRGDTQFWLRTAFFLLVGVYVLLNPVTVTRLLGRIVAVLLIIQGVKDLRGSGSRILGIATVVGGVVLFLLPATLTNALVMVLGVVLIVVGAIHLVEKLFLTRRLDSSSDPDIIDAEP